MYTSFFGFKEKPFNITPDPRFFYRNPLYNEVYANLYYAVKERKGFAALTGEVGTGKTTLLRKLMDDLAMTARFVYFYNTNLTFEELLSFVCEELRLQVDRRRGRLGKIRALNEFLLEQRRKGGTGVLLVDEAQKLGGDVLENLRLLSNIETASEKLLQIVLVGQPELKTKLDQPELRQLRQRISIYCRLDSLKEREVGPFVSYRLKAVGYKRNDLFTPEAIRKIAFYSNGLPRLINIICDNALLVAYGSRQDTISAEMIEEVAHDLQSGAQGRPNDVRDPAVETEPKDRKEEDLYSKADDGLHGKSISVARDVIRIEKQEQGRPITLTSEIIEEVAHDLQSGAERRPNNMRELAVNTEPKDRKEEDLYSKIENGLHGKSVTRKESPIREHLLDMKAGSAERERIVDVIPTEKTVFRIVDVSEEQDTPITISIAESRILNKVDGSRDVQAIANSLGLSYLVTAKALDRLNRSGFVKRVSNNGTSDTVPPQFFDLLNNALTDAMGPMARLVVRDGLATLGNSPANLPKASLGKLVELVSREILDDLLKIGFKERMSAVIGALDASDSRSIKEAP